MNDASKSDQPMKTLRTVKVSVKRKQETISSEVFPHEIDILNQLHPFEDVNVTDENYGKLDVPDDADLEFRRLQAKYDHKHNQVVARVYSNPRALAKATGLKMQQARAERAPGSALRGAGRRANKEQVAAA